MGSDLPDKDRIAEGLANALGRLLRKDSVILDSNGSERSITHRLAVYLEQEFPGWDVDCEYNRVGCHEQCPKRLYRLFQEVTLSPDDTEAKTVFPDIIVHRRATDENLLVIEAKKSTRKSTSEQGNTRDLLKLKAFTDPRELNYHLGVFLKIGIGGDSTELQFVIKGEIHGKAIVFDSSLPHPNVVAIRRNLEGLGYGE